MNKNMIKYINFLMLFIVMSSIVNPTILNAKSVEKENIVQTESNNENSKQIFNKSNSGNQETTTEFAQVDSIGKVRSNTTCLKTELTVDKETTYSGSSVRFELKYYSVQPPCTAEELAGTRIEIDFSELIDKNLQDALQTKLEETDHYIPTIEGNTLVLTFKDLTSLLDPGQGLTNFWGKLGFVINVKNVDEVTDVNITDNITGSADVTITPPSTGGSGRNNTEKWAEKDYVDQDDYLMYTIRLNNDWNAHDVIEMQDDLPRGVSLVENDATHPIRINRQLAADNHWPDEAYGDISDQFEVSTAKDSLHLKSKNSIDYGVVVRYWVHIDSEVASGEYTNLVSVNYDDQTEYEDYTVALNGGGGTGETGAGSFLELNKVDQFGNPVSGAEFTINDGTKNVETIITDENGYAKSAKHPYGSYMVYESKAPTGYELNSDHFYVDFEINNEIVQVNSGNPIVDIKDSGFIELNKVDQNNNPLSGAEFTVYDKDGKVIEVLTTDSTGYVKSSELPLGTYKVVETKAPLGYELAKPAFEEVVELNTDDMVYQLNSGKGIVNEQQVGQIDVHKVDQNNEALAGAEFTIYDESGNEIEVLVTNKLGYAISNDLIYGNYTVVETKAPLGYENANYTEKININQAGQIVHLNAGNNIVNEQQVGQIDLHKVDQDSSALANAEFTIYDKDGKEVEILITDETGYAISNNLEYGTYTVVETKAPSGYENDNYTETITINKPGQIISLNEGKGIVNEKEVPWIPIEPSDPIIPWLPIEPSNPVTPWLPVEPSNPVTPWLPVEPSNPIENLNETNSSDENTLNDDSATEEKIINTGNNFKFLIIINLVLVLITLVIVRKQIKA